MSGDLSDPLHRLKYVDVSRSPKVRSVLLAVEGQGQDVKEACPWNLGPEV